MEVSQKDISEIFSKLGVMVLRVSFLGKGNNNHNYLITSKKGNYVLRIECGIHFHNLKKEYAVLKKLNLGPKVFMFDSSGKIIPQSYLIEEYIEGQYIKVADLNFLKDSAIWYKKLHENKNKHSSEYSTPERFFDILKYFEMPSYSRYRKYRNYINKGRRKALDTYFREAQNVIAKNQRLFDDVKSLSLIHGDPSKGNVFYVNKKIRLIDWEFAKYDLPEYELAFFIWTHNLNKIQKNTSWSHTAIVTQKFHLKNFILSR